MAADRAADDGWADESEPRAAESEPRAAEGEPRTDESEPRAADLQPTVSPGPAAEAGGSESATDGWRGPEAAGRTPASIEPPPTPSPALPDDSGGGDEAATSDGETSAWRGPEAAGRTPASIQPPGVSAESAAFTEPAASVESAAFTEPGSVESTPSDAAGPSDELPSTSHGAESWRGPEATGWTPESARSAPPEPEPPARHQAARSDDWPAADRGLPRSTDGQPSDESGAADETDAADAEPARAGRAPAGFSFFNRARSDADESEEDADAGVGYVPSEHRRVEERPRRLPGRRAAVLVRADPAEICPFLVAASGGWRLAVPSREHRCGAVNPPSPLSPQKQTRLCLTEGHLRCATFLAAGAARESRVGSAAMPERVSRWALARTTPVVEEVGGVRTTLAGMLADRRRWPAIPAMLLVVALATLGLSSLRGGGAVTALASPTPQPTASAAPTASIAPSPSLESTPEASPSAAPTVAPTAAPTPAPTHATYTVVSGDTLGAIARQFGTTVQAIMDLNGITDPGKLKIGQVLQIP